MTLKFIAQLFLLLIPFMEMPINMTPSYFPPSAPFPVERFTLSNGLRVWVQPRADSQSVTAMLVLRAGARHETPANNGVSHFVEHMLFTGTERWSEDEVKDVITRRGGHYNGWTGTEITGYYAQVSSQDFDIALDWLSQLVFRPTFPANKVDKEREVIFQERWGRYGWIINMLDSLGLGYELDRDVRRALFPGSALGLRIVGEDASLASLDRAALLHYYEAHYAPSNAALVIVGNVASEQARVRVETYFGKLEKRQAAPELVTPRLPDSGPQQVVVRGPLPTDRTIIMLGARTVGSLHPDRWALDVLADILEEDLTKEIRNRRGLVYGLGAGNIYFNDTGYLYISTTSDSGNKDAILQAIEGHLDQVRRGEITPARVAEAQAALNGRWALSMEGNSGRASWLAEWAPILMDDQAVPDYQASISAVTPEDLARVVDTYFTPPRRSLGLHLPIATVTSATIGIGAVIALGVGTWGGRKLWQRRRKTQ